MEQFFSSVREDAKSNKIFFEKEKGDFWRYNYGSDSLNSYWTGYFSTYPDIKKSIYQFSDFVEAFMQTTSLSTKLDEKKLISQ